MRMRDAYEAIVIGSGFGGSVAACRMAQAGFSVGVFERGRSYEANPFPRDWNNLSNGWLWSEGQGLFDIRPFQEMTVVQSAGLGGGSLIYANVHLRLPDEVFANGWPRGYRRAVLDPYYDLVAYMLDINPITKSSHLGMPAKTKLMRDVARDLKRDQQFCYPNIAVDFGPPEVEHRNKFGALQKGCNYCGECDIGCNFHAKNTLDFNYLTVARSSGAEVGTQLEVLRIEPIADGIYNYNVHFRDHGNAAQPGECKAKHVFVCAGAVNSTELLLRCRDVYRTLPNLSDRVGYGYSGNGDFLAFAFDTKQQFKPSEGPTITTGIVYSRADGGFDNWFIFQEGGYPKEIGGLLQLLNPKRGLFREADVLTSEAFREAFHSASVGKAGVPDPQSDNTAIFLAMGRDLANGVIQLHSVSNDLKITWDTASNLPLYGAEGRFSTDVAEAMGGNVAVQPLWRLFHLPVSVHNLGGCPMAESSGSGVVDPNGEVFGYPNLFVLDGSILPKATGVNPSHTIAAVAERNIETAIRRLKDDDRWRAPDMDHAVPVIDPLTSIVIPPGGTLPTNTPAIGIAFTETMKGHVSKGWAPSDDYVGAENAGQTSNSLMEFTLTITMPDLDAFLVNPQHTGKAVGTVRVDGFTPPTSVPVSDGVFNLFVNGDEFYQRRMLYALPFTGSDGKPYLLDGFKDVRDDGHFDVWGATSTLYTVIREGHSREGSVLATGIMKIHIPDFLHQLTTFTAVGARTPIQKTKALARFGESFFGSLWDVFVRPHFE
ncbi:MAG: GMC family oxidoreductase [Candidatus Binataceae bacterium]